MSTETVKPHLTREWAENNLRLFSVSADDVIAQWADEVMFEDPILEQVHHDREVLRQSFIRYSNKDPENGIGIHTFTVEEFLSEPGQNPIVYRWKWVLKHASDFLGVPTNGKTIVTTGVNIDWFDDDGKVVREVAYWDFVKPALDLGLPVLNSEYWEEEAKEQQK
ncbi:hypothetical protein GCM10025863_19110 [Microbacterium suwonense]|uniref:SnoaL-like domain-containing protein n=1 Tax=Microbacterium suwonense TaxID=683047 RepID=A0ABN6X411_9MICO|nr:hypothetical protein GCM10025863_19110 [Microbacterium suwonense]